MPERWPFEQDGPAWWSAREAVERAAREPQRREAPRNLRTIFVAGDGDARLDAAVNAFLVGRDELGSLRFPELNALRDRPGSPDGARTIDEVTEPLVVGSLTSWLLALFALQLAA